MSHEVSFLVFWSIVSTVHEASRKYWEGLYV